jgi:enoyl-CoA hydratase/carnithine racemase
MKLSVAEGIAIVQFDRPEAMNAANLEMSYERVEIYSGLSQDDEVKVVIVTGNEQAYCAGGDIQTFAKFGVVEASEFAKRGVQYQKLLMDMPKPTIAAISGYAFGGGLESVLLCDLRIASESALFALPEINVGIFPGGGGTQRLVQNISNCQAKEMIFLGTRIDALKAYEMGLINKVVPQEQLLEEAMKWAKKLCQKSTISLQLAKKAVNAAWGIDIYSGMDMETQAWASLFGTNDQKEGMNAFLEKRKARFSNN